MIKFLKKTLTIKYIDILAVCGVISSILYLRLADEVGDHRLKISSVKIPVSDQEFVLIAGIFSICLLILLTSPIIYGVQHKNKYVLVIGVFGPLLLFLITSDFFISFATGHVAWTTFVVIYLGTVFIMSGLVKAFKLFICGFKDDKRFSDHEKR